MGPGIIVMVGDNDAGGVSTYAQAGQNYHTTLLWTLLLLIPVLIVNQEMVVRLGAVTGVGHARLINERFGRGWGWFSVGDLFLLNFLTIVTEFIGISLAGSYAGVSEYVSVPTAAVALVAIMATGSFQKWERAMFAFIAISLIQIPMFFLSHPHWGTIAKNFVVPSIYGGPTSAAVLLIIAIVGTTVAPWQLFFQQSNIVDKRITPRFISYERADTVIGSLVVVGGAAAIMVTANFAASGTPAFGHFTDALGVANMLKAKSHALGAMFAILLFDASIIGAAAVTLSTSYAFGDVFGIRHSLHRGFKDAKQFYVSYMAMVARGGRHRAHPGRPARPDHHQRPGPGRAAAALGQRVPAAALQRPRGARTVGQPGLAQRRGGRHRGHAAGSLRHADGHHPVPAHRRGLVFVGLTIGLAAAGLVAMVVLRILARRSGVPITAPPPADGPAWRRCPGACPRSPCSSR